MNLRNEIIKYCEKHGISTAKYCKEGISLSKICHGKDKHGKTYDNPFPIGGRNLYSAYLGKPISHATYAKLFEFFTNLNDKQ